MNNEEIKSIECVTSMGNGHFYAIGQDGVTSIKKESDQIAEYQWLYYFTVYKNDTIIARIGAFCPVVLTF